MGGFLSWDPRRVAELTYEELEAMIEYDERLPEVMTGRALIHYRNGHWAEARAAAAVALALLGMEA